MSGAKLVAFFLFIKHGVTGRDLSMKVKTLLDITIFKYTQHSLLCGAQKVKKS